MIYHRTLGFLALALVTVSCSTLNWCRSKRSPQVVQVRWPISVTKPLGKLDAQAPRPLASEVPTTVRPGVQVRTGRAHDIEFLEVILGDASFADPLPLVVLIHGRGDRPRIPGGPFGGIPTAMRVVLPRGPRPLGEGFSWLPVSITHGKLDVLTKALQTRAHHLAAFIDWVRNNRPTLGKPIVSGFSQGGMLSFALASLRPDVLVAAFPLAGWLPPALMPASAPNGLHGVRLRAAHGDADPIIPVDPTRQVVQAFQTLGWDAALEVFDGVAHVVDSRMNAAFESWLEQAVREQAPDLAGGLGTEGPEEEAYDDVESLDPDTIEAIMQEEVEAEAEAEAAAEQAEAAAEQADSGNATDATENETDEALTPTPEAPTDADEPAPDTLPNP